MPEVLHDHPTVERVHTLRGPAAVLDPTTAQVLETAIAEATDHAYREGEAAGRAAAIDAADRAGAAVAGALDALHTEVRAQVGTATQINLAFAGEVAAAVLERTPPDEALAVLDRVHRAVEALDELPLRVRLHPDDHAILAGNTPDALELIADASVAPGDARVVGATSGAELTRQAMLAAAVDVLGEGRA